MESIQEKASLLYRGEALAPMVRASTTPLRMLAANYGADFVYSEELVDRSLLECHRVVNERLGTIDYVKDTSHMSKKKQRKLDGHLPLILRIVRGRERLVCQLGTGEPQTAVEAALRVHRDVQAIDVNMGCPKKFSVSGGMGSALLEDPERAARIIRALADNVSSSNSSNPIPVSAKIRLLKDTQVTLDFATALVNAGANAVAIHGRRTGDKDVDAADWETLKDVVSLLTTKFPHIPFLVNGDFYTRDEFHEFQQQSGAAGVLLARPALYNTSIFRKPSAIATDDDGDDRGPFGYTSKLLLDRTTVIQDYLRQVLHYETHYKNVKYVVCEMMGTRRTPTDRVRFLKQKFPGGQTMQSVCRCSSVDDICKVWGVKTSAPAVFASTVALPPVDEHTYSDEYNLALDSSSRIAKADDYDNATDDASPMRKRPRTEDASSKARAS